MVLNPTRRGTRSNHCHGTTALGVAELAELGGNVPNGKPGMRVENGIDVPPLLCRDVHERLVASLPPSPDVLSSLLESSPQGVGRLLVEAVQGVAVHVVPHLGLVDVARSCILCVPEHLVCHLLEKEKPKLK